VPVRWRLRLGFVRTNRFDGTSRSFTSQCSYRTVAATEEVPLTMRYNLTTNHFSGNAEIADIAGSGKRRTLFYLHRPAGRYLMY
jgi:hypothetical protein